MAMNGIARRSLMLGGAGVLATPLVAGAQAPAVKLGILQPVTGALSQDGEYGRLGAELAIAEINAGGGIRALGGARIETVFGDARSNPEGGVAEVEKMQAEGVTAIASPARSAWRPRRRPRATTCPMWWMSACRTRS
jgi:branched-chain amino acid transport system substrate-binding protein